MRQLNGRVTIECEKDRHKFVIEEYQYSLLNEGKSDYAYLLGFISTLSNGENFTEGVKCPFCGFRIEKILDDKCSICNEIEKHLNENHPIKEVYHPYLRNINNVWKVVFLQNPDTGDSCLICKKEIARG